MKLEHTRGDTMIRQISLTSEGAAVDLTGCELSFNIKKSITDFEYVHEEQLDIVDAVNGAAELRIEDVETGVWEVRDYKYSLKFRDASGVLTTILIDDLVINFSV